METMTTFGSGLRRLALSSLLAIACVGGIAPPADALLGASVLQFRKTQLIKGDDLFRYEGRVGARYKFGAARRCRFGTGLLMFDTIDAMVVQQTIVLPLPNSTREGNVLKRVVTLFLDDAGLDAEQKSATMALYLEALKTGKGGEKELGVSPKLINLNVVCSPALRSVMIIVGLKP